MDNVVMWAPGTTLEQVEKQIILAAFRYNRGNKTITASSLGIAIRTLDAKLDSYTREDEKNAEIELKREQDRRDYMRRARGPHAYTSASGEDFDDVHGNRAAHAAHVKANPGLAGDKVEAKPSNPTATGDGAEPISQSAEKSAMSLPVGKEVQKVLPSNTPASGAAKPRR